MFAFEFRSAKIKKFSKNGLKQVKAHEYKLQISNFLLNLAV